MTKPTRAQALAWIRTHAYHGADALAVRIYVENRISRAAFDDAVRAGRAMRARDDAANAQRELEQLEQQAVA